jgi:hypothetical protein
METNGKQVEYHSSDIRKKPKKNLLVNIKQENKIGKSLKSDNLLLTISVVAAVLTLAILIFTISILYPYRHDDTTPDASQQQDVEQIRDETEDYSSNTNGQEVDAMIADIEGKIAAAEASGDSATAYQLKLLKIDIQIKTGTAFVALNSDIIPMLDSLDFNSKPSQFYDLYTRAYLASKDMNELERSRDYLESIINLPDEAFPMTSDDTFREHYVTLLKELQ